MMTIKWTEELSVGNEAIDSDHIRLMELINDIAKARDKFALLRAFKLFKACIISHHINEEQYALALKFPFGLHKVAHQNISVKIELIGHELEKNGAAAVFETDTYAQFLRDWLIKHITEEDMQMKPLLQTCPYGFKVGGALRS